MQMRILINKWKRKICKCFVPVCNASFIFLEHSGPGTHNPSSILNPVLLWVAEAYMYLCFYCESLHEISAQVICIIDFFFFLQNRSSSNCFRHKALHHYFGCHAKYKLTFTYSVGIISNVMNRLTESFSHLDKT